MTEKKSAPVAKKADPKKEAAAKAARDKKVEAKKKPSGKERAKIQMNPKLADPESVLKGYDQLIERLAKVEAEQRMKNKPYRIYVIHRKRLEVMKLNFIKSLR